jgi:hypothetical protein
MVGERIYAYHCECGPIWSQWLSFASNQWCHASVSIAALHGTMARTTVYQSIRLFIKTHSKYSPVKINFMCLTTAKKIIIFCSTYMMLHDVYYVFYLFIFILNQSNKKRHHSLRIAMHSELKP